jgi:transposase
MVRLFCIRLLQQVLCNAHHIRELTANWEDHKQLWAKNIIHFLIAAKQEIDVSGLPSEERAKRWEASYMRFLNYGK